jgi:hypothetical protein
VPAIVHDDKGAHQKPACRKSQRQRQPVGIAEALIHQEIQPCERKNRIHDLPDTAFVIGRAVWINQIAPHNGDRGAWDTGV